MSPASRPVEKNPFPRDRAFLLKLAVAIVAAAAAIYFVARTVRRALAPAPTPVTPATEAPR